MSTAKSQLGKAAVLGAGGGMIAAMAMAMYAMIAGYLNNTGFFTPLFHIASLFISNDAMTTSMQHAMSGSQFYFAAGPALLGALIHMMTGAMYGAMFAVLVTLLKLSRGTVLLLGMVYGVMAFVLSSFIGLPLAATIFGSGDQITHMARMVGWTTFLLEHLMFGIALGAVTVGVRVRALAPVSAH